MPPFYPPMGREWDRGAAAMGRAPIRPYRASFSVTPPSWLSLPSPKRPR